MKFKLISDVHLEFGDFNIKNDGVDTLVIAGDLLIVEDLHDIAKEEMDNRFAQQLLSNKLLKVQDFRNFLAHVSKEFKHVVYVMGNHEFYNGRLFGSVRHLREELEEYPNIHLLDDQSVTIEGVKFIGGTLWTDFNKLNPLVMNDAGQFMNDYKVIRHDKHGNYRKLAPKDTAAKYVQTAHYIRNTLLDTVQPVVVVTHHAPSFMSIPECYKSDSLNGAYASELSELILDFPNIRYWLHGHIHSSLDYTIGDTRVVCNPRGYSGYELNPKFNPNLILEI